MFVDIYAIQTVPPSNINRDDTGSPKTAVYGGKLRARVSSQAWKRAMRNEFAELLPAEKLGIRTKFAVQLIAEAIVEHNVQYEEKAEDLAESVLKAIELKIEKSSQAGEATGAKITEYLLFIAPTEIQELAELAISWDERGLNTKKPSSKMKKEVEDVLTGTQAIDVALFGRMLADAPRCNTDASAQVAHAISVDEVQTDYDYFTAMDDRAPKDNAGATMIDTVAFNSSTLYRYATVNLSSLSEQLGEIEATAAAAATFVEAFIRSMPTGKQNTFANRTLPSTVYVALRASQPVNAVFAFEVPIRPSAEKSVSHQAAERLGATLQEIERAYGTDRTQAWYVTTETGIEALSAIGDKTNLPALVEDLRAAVGTLLAQKEQQ